MAGGFDCGFDTGFENEGCNETPTVRRVLRSPRYGITRRAVAALIGLFR